jgi:putative hydrolase of the HAD superfamily
MAFEVIIFDLDNTLYPRDSGVMQEIGRRIHVWIRDRFYVTPEEAAALRRQYLQNYGSTMNGLIVEHDIDHQDFLDFVHDIPLEEYLAPDPALDAMLASIPLRKVIYTNATTAHARRVLRTLDVERHFECVVGIDDMNLRNKFNHDAYERMLEMIGARGPTCIMVEDSVYNLSPAKALGLTTILVDGEPSEYADIEVESVLEVGAVVDRLLERG